MSGITMGMILAAGAGTRARHLTDIRRTAYPVAKPMFRLLDTPIMHHTVLEMQRQGITDIFCNVWSNPDTLESYYSNIAPGAVKMYRESQLMGTMGSAVHWTIEHGIGDADRVFVISGDIASNADLGRILAEHERVGADATIAFNPVDWSQVPKYGTAYLEGMPEKRPQRSDETVEQYASYLRSYIADMDRYIKGTSYSAVQVHQFREKASIADCCSNANNSSIYLFNGSVIRALYERGITPTTEKTDPFYDFGAHGFRHILEQGMKFFGVLLPHEVYWADIGDMGKYWLAIMDTLDGRFDRSMWPSIIPQADKESEVISFIHPSAKIHDTAELIPPYYIGPDVHIGAGARVERASLSRGSLIGPNSTVYASAVLESSHYHSGDTIRQLRGDGTRGSILQRSLMASGFLAPGQMASNNVVLTTPDGYVRFAPIGMDKDLSEQRARGAHVPAVEAISLDAIGQAVVHRN